MFVFLGGLRAVCKCVARTRHITVKGRETRRKKLEKGEEHFAHIPLESEPSIAWETIPENGIEREKKRKVCFLSFLSSLLPIPLFSLAFFSFSLRLRAAN